MTRNECEKKLEDLMREMWETYQRYNPFGQYLAITFVGDRMSANNSYWDTDANKPISVFKGIDEIEEEKEVN